MSDELPSEEEVRMSDDGRVDLADFLLARVSEDEEAARRILSPLGWGGVLTEMEALDPEEANIARWDPARVLAECEAKRKIVKTWQDRAAKELAHPRLYDMDGSLDALEGVVRVLAEAYDYHLGYQQSWRP